MSERSPSRSEAGFTLIEVLAALAIASLTVVMALQLFSGTARLGQRVAMEISARDVARTLLADGRTGQGRAGPFQWQAGLAEAGPGLMLRQVAVGWPGGGALTLRRLEPVTEGAP